MTKKQTESNAVHELLYQALEAEIGGAKIYEAALVCATNENLRQEWKQFYDETITHQQVLHSVFQELGLDPHQQSPGRQAVAMHGEALLKIIRHTRESADASVAQIVAAECVLLAETKDNQNWTLIGLIAKQLVGKEAQILRRAHEAVERDADHHLYHTKGWARELWMELLGFPAVLPLPEKINHTELAAGAAGAERERGKML